jgi:hypothetical protein
MLSHAAGGAGSARLLVATARHLGLDRGLGWPGETPPAGGGLGWPADSTDATDEAGAPGTEEPAPDALAA